MRVSLLILGLSVLSATAAASASVEVRFEGDRTLLAENVEMRGSMAVLTLPGGGQLAVESRLVRAILPLADAPEPVPPQVDPRRVEPSVMDPPLVSPPADDAAASPQPHSFFPPGAWHGGYGALIHEAARRHGVDPELLRCVLLVESGFDPAAVSPKGALGIAQLMPATAGELGVHDPFEPEQAVEGAARLLSRLLEESGGKFVPALAAYNAGPGAVRRYGGVPPYGETIRYIERVLTLYYAP